MSNYLTWLTFLLANIDKIKSIIAILRELYSGLPQSPADASAAATSNDGVLAITLEDDAEPSPEVAAAEAQVLSLLAEDAGDGSTQAVRDGRVLRKLFEIAQQLGPLLPTLISLFGAKK